MNATAARKVIPLFAHRIRCHVCRRLFRAATPSATVAAYLEHPCCTGGAR